MEHACARPHDRHHPYRMAVIGASPHGSNMLGTTTRSAATQRNEPAEMSRHGYYYTTGTGRA
jgi:hypothetical protein